MTYYESAEDQIITRERAIQELKKHGIYDFEVFFSDLGDFEAYEAIDVLEWLGYWYGAYEAINRNIGRLALEKLWMSFNIHFVAFNSSRNVFLA